MDINTRKKSRFFSKVVVASTRLVERLLPNAFVFAALLTPIVLLGSIFLTQQNPLRVIDHWYKGIWSLHAFAMQMSLMVVTGYALALSPFFKKILTNMASIPKTDVQGIMVVTFVSAIACWIQWGFGLIIGVIFAKEVVKKLPNIDYRLLIASAYSGFLVWHAGFSGSIPLKIASEGSDLEKITNGVLSTPIPITETIFAPFTLIPAIVLVLTLPILNALMHPKGDAVVRISSDMLKDSVEDRNEKPRTPAERLDSAHIISFIVGIMGLIIIVSHFIKSGFSLNLNLVIFIFLILALLFHKTPKNFVHAVWASVKGVAGIIIQYPLYAGIMGMMIGTNADGVSLASTLTQMFVNISNEITFPFFTFLSAGIVNIFVPSGGGQWIVQAPVFMPAAAELGVDYAKTAMAIAWGDAWTNMFQPFWALPVLGIAGLDARNIMGFCLITMLYAGIIISLGLFLF